jgi:hypothetical protein
VPRQSAAYAEEKVMKATKNPIIDSCIIFPLLKISPV